MASAGPDADGDTPMLTTEVATDAPTPATTTNVPGAQTTISPEQQSAMQDILNYIYDYRTPEGHDPSKLFHKRVNKRVLPDYYEVIKEPQAMSNIKQKISSKTPYLSFQEYVRDWALICHNAQVYNRPDAGAYHDALTIKALVEAELKKLIDAGTITAEQAAFPYMGEIPHADEIIVEDGAAEDESSASEDTDEEAKPRGRGRPKKRDDGAEKDEPTRVGDMESRKKRGRPPKVDTPMESRIKNILKALRRFKNPAGEYKILSFDRLPDKAVMPGYYMEIANPMAVDILKKKLKRKKYTSMEQFMQDVELMFENAKLFNEDASPIYKDAVDLQLEARKLLAIEQAKPDTDFVMEDGRIPLPEGILHNGELYRVGDWVHIQNANDLTKPIVTQIYRTWQDASGQKFVNVCWYYRPEQTVHRFDKHFFSNEVTKTGQYRDHSIEEIVNRCFVMFITRYNKGRPRGYPTDKEIYVCESRYNEEKLTFNKIKTWASCLPDEVRDKDYEMELYTEQKKMKKQPSPIAYLLKEDAKETDDLPKPEWGADNAPPKIGAVHKRPRDPRDSPPPAPTPSPPPTPPPAPAQPVRPVPIASQPLQNFRNQASSFSSSTPLQQSHTQGGASATPAGLGQQSHLQHQTSASPAPLSQARPAPTQRGSSYNNNTSTNNQTTYKSSLNTNTSYTSTPATATTSTLLNPLRPSTTFNNSAHTPSVSASNTTSAYAPPPFTSMTSYKTPQPIEAWSLNDAANASIPPDIRSQFLRDAAGRILFFTAPPVEFAGSAGSVRATLPLTNGVFVDGAAGAGTTTGTGMGMGLGMSLGLGQSDADTSDEHMDIGTLGHTPSYMAHKLRTADLRAEKLKRRAEARLEREEKRLKVQEELAAALKAGQRAVVDRAMAVWERQLREATEEEFGGDV